MECNPCAHDQGWRAIHGKRTEELLRDSAAGLQTAWEEDRDKGWHRLRRRCAGSQVAARLSGRLEEPGTPPNARKLELFQRRNSSSKFQDLIKWTPSGPEKCETVSINGLQGPAAGSTGFRSSHSLKRQIAPPGEQHFVQVLQHRFVSENPGSSDGYKPHSGGKAPSCTHHDQHDMRGIISHSYMVSDPAVLSHRRASHVHAAENPCRWGVDVFNYQLPEPRKLRGFGTEENLGAGLIPRQSFDELACVERRMKSCTHQDYTRGHLEQSTLYPAESDCIKVAQGKRRNKVDGDNLDQTCTPFTAEAFRTARRVVPTGQQSHLRAGMIPSVGPESCAKRCSGQWHMRSLQIDMTPQNTATTKTGRRQHPEWHRESLHRGSLLPL